MWEDAVGGFNAIEALTKAIYAVIELEHYLNKFSVLIDSGARRGIDLFNTL